MVTTAYLLTALMLFSIALITSTTGAVYSPRQHVIPVDEETQREMIDDLLQREYADRYRNYIESGLALASKSNMGDVEAEGELHPNSKRGQTFVRFGKRSQTFVRFGK